MTKSVHHQSATPEHYTPAVYADAARYVLGSIDLDPGSSAVANQTIGADEFYDHDGERKPWRGNVYCNAPGERTGALIRAYWRRACQHAFDGGSVRWAGFATAQLSSLAFLDPIATAGGTIECPGPLRWPTVLIGPQGPCTTGGGRICWTNAETMQPGKQPGHGNFFTLLTFDHAKGSRFFERFGPWGAACAPRPLFPHRIRIAHQLTLLGATETT